MIQLYHEGHSYHYETERLVRMFLARPVQKAEQIPTEPPYIITRIDKSGEIPLLSVVIDLDGNKTALRAEASCGETLELGICRLLYGGLSRFAGGSLRWGLITGVRPIKLVRGLINQGMGQSEARSRLVEHYLTSGQAADLALKVIATQDKAVKTPQPDEFYFYISIPFCPTRCSYCSFVSHSVAKAARLIPQYIDILCGEIASVGSFAASRGLKLSGVYIGGGTPTTLDAGQLARVMGAVRQSFDFKWLKEYTVEAGRPDTITREKLEVIRNGGAGRISINPQTISDRLLANIGRAHSGEDFFRAFDIAREAGFSSINTDIIAGLPGDTGEEFADTLGRILKLNPENVTVHTLSVKRAARMGTELSYDIKAAAPVVGEMLTKAKGMLARAGQRPYYLYRQQNTPGGYENVGYALEGKECIYNIVMMDETGCVLSAGAGGVTRFIKPDGKVGRIFAPKYPYEYISGTKKSMIEAYYENDL